ncbi:hypothetical protein PG991_001824 [Apiospora marii]|uniref:Uncharacterized protein n=1 Tax=Apiospora marii TaxID=335849 RepID=A0ABR1SPG5_9PEZI
MNRTGACKWGLPSFEHHAFHSRIASVPSHLGYFAHADPLRKQPVLVPYHDHDIVQGKPRDVDPGVVAPVLGLGQEHEVVRGSRDVLALVRGNHVAHDVVGVVQDLGFLDQERLGLECLPARAPFPEVFFSGFFTAEPKRRRRGLAY